MSSPLNPELGVINALGRVALWLNRGSNGLNFTAAVTIPLFLIAVILAIEFLGA